MYSVVHTVVKRQQTYKPQAETIPNYVIPVPYHYVYRTTSTILVALLVLLDCTLVLSVLVLLVLFTSPAASILHLFRGNIVCPHLDLIVAPSDYRLAPLLTISLLQSSS